MKAIELIEELQKLPEYATARALKRNKGFYHLDYVREVILQPRDDDDDYFECYVDIK